MGLDLNSNKILSTTITPEGASFLNQTVVATGGDQIIYNGEWKIHRFNNSGTFSITGTTIIDYLIVGGGGGGGTNMGGGGGGGGVIVNSRILSTGAYSVVIGGGGSGAPAGTGSHPTTRGTVGTNSSFNSILAYGGGYGGLSPNSLGYQTGGNGGCGGGASGYNDTNTTPGQYYGTGMPTYGFNGGSQGNQYYSGGGGGAGSPGINGNRKANGGKGRYSDILGRPFYFGGGGGGAGYSINGGDGGIGGGGGGAAGWPPGAAGQQSVAWGAPGQGTCTSCQDNKPGGNGGTNTGGGGGGGSHYNYTNAGGNGGSGIVIIRYKYRGIDNLGGNGTSQATAGMSAASIKLLYPSSSDGVYWINLPNIGPTQIYCIMNSIYDGGGWMMMMKATRGTTFNYDSTYWTANNTLNPTDLTRNDADAKYNTMNYYPAKDMMAIFPDISNIGSTSGSISGLTNWTWLQNDFNNGKNVIPINFFANPSMMERYYSPTYGGAGNFIQDAKRFNGWGSGIFSSQVDIRFYGYNYIPNPSYSSTMKARWGFGWNENSDGLFPCDNVSYIGSNDVTGGIGLGAGGQNYSAGDYVACCADSTGINRSARVEIYIR